MVLRPLSRPSDAFPPDVAVGRSDCTPLPATWLLTAEFDPLRDEDELAYQLAKQGVDVCMSTTTTPTMAS